KSPSCLFQTVAGVSQKGLLSRSVLCKEGRTSGRLLSRPSAMQSSERGREPESLPEYCLVCEPDASLHLAQPPGFVAVRAANSAHLQSDLLPPIPLLHGSSQPPAYRNSQ